MKKYVSIILLVFILSQNAVAKGFCTSDSNGYDSVLLFEAFENEDSFNQNWDGSIASFEDEGAAKINFDTSLSMKKNAASELYSEQRKPYLKRIKLEMKFYFTEKTDVTVGFCMSDSELKEITAFSSAGVISTANCEGEAYPIGEWFSVVCYINFDKSTVKLYSENTFLKETALPVGLTLDGTPCLKIQGSSVGVAYVDNIKLSAPVYTYKRLTYSERIAGSDFDDGAGLSGQFDLKGLSCVQPSVVDNEERQNVVELMNEDINGNLTDSIFRGKYSIVNPSYSTAPFCGAQKEHYKHIVFDINLCLNTATKLAVQFIGQDSDGARSNITLVSFREDGSFYLINNESTCYEINKWYEFRFYINLDQNTYSACVNSEMLASDIPILTDSDMYILSCGVQMLNKNTPATVYIDDLFYYAVTYKESKNFTVIESGEQAVSVAHIGSYEMAELLGGVYGENGRLKAFYRDNSRNDEFYVVDFEYEQGDLLYYMLWDSMTNMSPLEKIHMVKR